MGIVEKRMWEDRELMIYLPPSYNKYDDTQYPALLVQDRGYLFLDSLSTIENDIKERKIEKVIFIGIPSNHRDEEYTPWKMINKQGEVLGGGHADTYLDLVVDELLPFLRKHYRLSNEKSNIGMAGASFGGLVSLYGLLTKPNSFGKFCVLSPSLWYANFISYIEQNPKIDGETKVFMYVGEKEGNNRPDPLCDMVPNNKKAYQLLKNKLVHEDASIYLIIDANGVHLHSYFIAHFVKGIRYLFPKLPTHTERKLVNEYR